MRNCTHEVLGQVIVHPSGLYKDFKLYYGHNNDQGAFLRSGIADVLIENEFHLLGDGGYHHYTVLTPILAHIEGFAGNLCAERSIVETSIGRIKDWAILRHKWTLRSVELQVQTILVCAELTQLQHMQSLNRPTKFSSEQRELLFKLSQEFLFLSETEKVSAIKKLLN